MPDRDEAPTNAGEDGADDEGEEDEYEDEGPAMSFNWFDDLFVYDTGKLCTRLAYQIRRSILTGCRVCVVRVLCNRIEGLGASTGQR
jgi:hypothetical protein